MKYWISGGVAALAVTAGAAIADSSSTEWAPETFTLGNGMEVVAACEALVAAAAAQETC